MSDLFSVEDAQHRGWQAFLGLEFLVAPGVLVPRPETEILGRAAIEVLEGAVRARGEARVVDLCCGSGNLACAMARHVSGVRAWAVDLLPASAALARRNAVALGVDGRVSVLEGDLLAPLSGLGLEGTLDALVCNPPYISAGRLAGDRSSLLEREPREAFDGGPYGLSIHQRVARESGRFLREGSPLLMEIGVGQDRQVALLLQRAGGWSSPNYLRDQDGTARAVVAYRRPEPSST